MLRMVQPGLGSNPPIFSRIRGGPSCHRVDQPELTRRVVELLDEGRGFLDHGERARVAGGVLGAEAQQALAPFRQNGTAPDVEDAAIDSDAADFVAAVVCMVRADIAAW